MHKHLDDDVPELREDCTLGTVPVSRGELGSGMRQGMQRVRVCRDHDTARQVEDAPSSFPSRLSYFSEGTARLVRAEARAVARPGL